MILFADDEQVAHLVAVHHGYALGDKGTFMKGLPPPHLAVAVPSVVNGEW